MFFKYMVLIVVTASIINGQKLGDFPLDVVGDILSILFYGTVRLIGNCDGADNSAPETNYWIYTNNNPNNPIIVTEPTASMCGHNSRIIFLIHGWSWDANAPYTVGIKDAYLKRYNDVCIISVNWGFYAKRNYQSAYCTVPGVTSNIANFICSLKNNFNVDTEKLHLVGHSMGAQIFGNVGNSVQHKCASKIGRITGLDPAGPLFNGISTKDRLDPTDAMFVDVIHTNQGKYGYLGSCGHFDAFPNCGYSQPGCLEKVIGEEVFKNISAVLNIPLDLVSCNHRRSCDYFEESIQSDKFVGQPCLLCGLPTCTPTFSSSEKKVVGEDCTSPGSVQNYVLYTRSTPPYAKG